MSIMCQSSRAQDQTLGVWFIKIQQGMIKLPRFQRFEAWDRARITSFLGTIINNLPVGVTLVLEVAGTEKFHSRYIATAEPNAPVALGGGVTQHLLDGQQRLTAFWRSMHNNYEYETFFVYLPEFDLQEPKSGTELEIRCIPRYINNTQQKMPRWAEVPASCFERGLLPISLLCPGDISREIDSWLKDALEQLFPTANESDKFMAYMETREKIKAEITRLRERVAHFNLPYLSLPSDTSKDIALQVFINMNTNSKPLSLYDIIVAEVENVAEKSLHDLVASLDVMCPNVSRYGDVKDLILSTSALLQEKLPNSRGMIEMDKQVLLDNWQKLERGLERMALFLNGQGVFDEARLPTNAVLAVIAASYEMIPDEGDFRGKAEKLLRQYLWSAFFTDRYESSAPSSAFADFKAIKALLMRPDFHDIEISSIPALNRTKHPLSDVDSLLAAGWPKAAGIEARAILAVTTYLGAIDFADGQRATYDNVSKREYHHVFPDALLSKAGIPSFLALNCALITWKTNRIIGRNDPLEYLKDRVEWATEEVVSQRLKSHLISYELISTATYSDIEEDVLNDQLKNDFDNFKMNRAKLIFATMNMLAKGEEPTLATLWQ